MNIQTDSSNQSYVEKECYGEHIRLTYIEKSGWGVPAVRTQIRDESGHLRSGPEIPVEMMGDVASKMIELLLENGESIVKEILMR